MNNMKDDFDALAYKIKNLIGDDNLFYVANPGNWGDALIRQGTLKFLRDHNINYSELTLSKKNWLIPMFKGGTVLYGGGGGWCKHWNTSDSVRTISKRFKTIVLPSTYEVAFDIKNTYFFRRDEFESRINMPKSIFCHDMAFYLGEIPFTKGRGVGNFFRTDKESSNKFTIPESNLDISRVGNHFSEGITFFKEIGKYSVIHTDRLHVSIAASLMKKEVHLYPNSYFKNEAVFKSSLAPYFNNVFFHSESKII